MTIKDTFGIYREVETTPETWAQLYSAGLLTHGVLDINQIERSNGNGYNDVADRRNGNKRYN